MPYWKLALMLVRWIHFLAGVTWVGLLYFFNLVSAPFLKELDGNVKSRIFPGLMARAMWWFRWSSVVTVFVGFGYWNMIVAADARNAAAFEVTAHVLDEAMQLRGHPQARGPVVGAARAFMVGTVGRICILHGGIQTPDVTPLQPF